MARSHHHLRPRAGERALLASPPLGGAPVELGRADGCFAHGPHCVTRFGWSVAAAAAAAAASTAATAAGHHGPRSREGGQQPRDRRGAAVGAADVVRLAAAPAPRTCPSSLHTGTRKSACAKHTGRYADPASLVSAPELEQCTNPLSSSARAESAPWSPPASAPVSYGRGEDPDLGGCRLLLIATPDAVIADVCEALASRLDPAAGVVHFSGATERRDARRRARAARERPPAADRLARPRPRPARGRLSPP